MFNNIEIDK